MYKKMLVPLDGSEVAEVALTYAKELAGRLDLDVVLFHVCVPEERELASMHRAYVERAAELVSRQSGEVQQQAGIQSGGKALQARAELAVGHPAEEILRYADENDIDLILMSTHGRSGIRRWVIGSVAAKVVRATKRPIALIRADRVCRDAGDRGITGKVLVPLDGSKESEAVIPYVQELASKLDGEVVLFLVAAPTYPAYILPSEPVPVPVSKEEMERVRSKAKEYLEKVGSALKGKGIKTKSEVGFGSAADEIIKFADEIDADLVAMSTHGRSGLSRWAYGSVADKVLHGVTSPIFLVRPQ